MSTAAPCRWTAAVLFALAAPAGAADTSQLALGRELFTKTAVPACAVCHTLADAGASGAVGPVLDELKPDAARVAKALRGGIETYWWRSGYRSAIPPMPGPICSPRCG